MTISRSPELARAKAILERSTLAPGARERVYWRIVHKPDRLAHGRWHVSMMVLGWLTAASAAYGLGRIVYSTLPALRDEPAAVSSAQPRAAQATLRRATKHGRSDAAARDSVASAAHDSPASLRTVPVPETASPPTNVATATPLHDTSVSRTPTGLTNVATATSTPAAAPGRLATDNASSQATPKPRTDPTTASAETPASDGASALRLQVADYKEAVALLNAQPDAALERLYAHRRHWPSSAIAHEVDLRIIQSLLALGRTDAARAAARNFLLHYPGSARVKEVSRIAAGND